MSNINGQENWHTRRHDLAMACRKPGSVSGTPQYPSGAGKAPPNEGAHDRYLRMGKMRGGLAVR